MLALSSATPSRVAEEYNLRAQQSSKDLYAKFCDGAQILRKEFPARLHAVIEFGVKSTGPDGTTKNHRVASLEINNIGEGGKIKVNLSLHKYQEIIAAALPEIVASSSVAIPVTKPLSTMATSESISTSEEPSVSPSSSSSVSTSTALTTTAIATAIPQIMASSSITTTLTPTPTSVTSSPDVVTVKKIPFLLTSQIRGFVMDRTEWEYFADVAKVLIVLEKIFKEGFSLPTFEKNAEMYFTALTLKKGKTSDTDKIEEIRAVANDSQMIRFGSTSNVRNEELHYQGANHFVGIEEYFQSLCQSARGITLPSRIPKTAVGETVSLGGDIQKAEGKERDSGAKAKEESKVLSAPTQ